MQLNCYQNISGNVPISTTFWLDIFSTIQIQNVHFFFNFSFCLSSAFIALDVDLLFNGLSHWNDTFDLIKATFENY